MRILLTKEGTKFYVKDISQDFHTKFGFLKKSDLKKKEGTVIKSNTKTEFLILNATFNDRYEKIKRGPQIIPKKDIGQILIETGINPESKVVDAGSGSGALCTYMARIAKSVTSYEIRDDFYKIAKYNKEFLELDNLKIKQKNICEGIQEKNVDIITLDLPDPWNAIPACQKALKIGGILVSYSPTIPQVMDTIKALEKTKQFTILKTSEIIEREWDVIQRKVRPRSQTIGHSGFYNICTICEMVLEQFFQVEWVERKSHSFFIAIIFSIIGIVSARLIFPNDVGLMSLAFISILLIPTLGSLLLLEENKEIREEKFSLIGLFKDHYDIIKVYTFVFFGCFIVFLLIGLLFPLPAINDLFFPQFRAANIVGSAINVEGFMGLVVNNTLVFLVAFILSFIYGAGAVIFLVWNASVWGIAFGFWGREAFFAESFTGVFAYLLPFFPHTFVEGLSYLFAAIVGGVVSKAVIREQLFSKKFMHIITDAMILFVIGLLLVLVAGLWEARFL